MNVVLHQFVGIHIEGKLLKLLQFTDFFYVREFNFKNSYQFWMFYIRADYFNLFNKSDLVLSVFHSRKESFPNEKQGKVWTIYGDLHLCTENSAMNNLQR